MFELFKIGWSITAPGMFLVLILAIGAVLVWAGGGRTGVLGRILVGLAAAGFLVIALTPAGQCGVAFLENRFPRPDPMPSQVDGIIVLGGPVSPSLSVARGEPVVSGSVERLLDFMILARRYPQAQLVFSGGSGRLGGEPASEADVSRDMMARTGFDTSRITFEDRSRNTRENALASNALVKPQEGETWILVTSGYHMPRAVGVFRAIGWDVIAWPTDWRTSGVCGQGFSPLQQGLNGGLSQVWTFSRELLGLIAYHLAGWTDTLLPLPDGEAG